MDAWTLGHSTHSPEDFLALVRAHRIEQIADVRRYPASRRHPHFNAGPLAQTLAAASIDYLPCPGLGGRRAARRDSRNTVWRIESFRGYADYMETPAFEEALTHLLVAAAKKRTAVMCAEAVWWQCHRQMIADALKARGVVVQHILDETKTTEHPFTAAARIVDGQLRYGQTTDSLHHLWEGSERA